jgi:hypothetical protein
MVVHGGVTHPATENQNGPLSSEIPTERAPEQSAEAARIAAKRLSPAAAAEEIWCDSEAPTGVATERPLLPRPPRNPQV